MKQLFTLLLLFVVCIFVSAQDRVQVQSDSLKIIIEKDGALFHNSEEYTYGFSTTEDEVLVYTSNLWFLGYDSEGNLRGAHESYTLPNRMHIAGTINNGQQTRASNPLTQVSAVEIENHRASFGEQGYEMPAGIAKWPANGDTTIGEMWQMAPFIDLNDNGLYEPEKGEYPDIFGDVCVYLIKNDGASTLEDPLGVEEHYMIGLFNTGHKGSTHLEQTMVLNTTLYHRGSVPIDTLHVGWFHDGDFGNPTDDFISTSATNNAVIFFNGDVNDDVDATTFKGFGLNPPALAIGSMFCNLWGSMYDNLSGIDEEQNLQAKWSDGTCQIQAGSGHVSSITGSDYELTRYAYDGALDSDTGWTEFNASNNPGDRRALTILQPKVFHPGDQISYTLAFHLAQGEGLDHVGNAILASEQIALVEDELLSIYGDHPRLALSINCESLEIDRDCPNQVGISEESEVSAYSLFPNPSGSGEIHFEVNHSVNKMVVLNTLGQQVETIQQPKRNIILNLPSGQYIAQIWFENGTVANEKIVVH